MKIQNQHTTLWLFAGSRFRHYCCWTSTIFRFWFIIASSSSNQISKCGDSCPAAFFIDDSGDFCWPAFVDLVPYADFILSNNEIAEIVPSASAVFNFSTKLSHSAFVSFNLIFLFYHLPLSRMRPRELLWRVTMRLFLSDFLPHFLRFLSHCRSPF